MVVNAAVEYLLNVRLEGGTVILTNWQVFGPYFRAIGKFVHFHSRVRLLQGGELVQLRLPLFLEVVRDGGDDVWLLGSDAHRVLFDH